MIVRMVGWDSAWYAGVGGQTSPRHCRHVTQLPTVDTNNVIMDSILIWKQNLRFIFCKVLKVFRKIFDGINQSSVIMDKIITA